MGRVDRGDEPTPVGDKTPWPAQKVQEDPRSSVKDRGKSPVVPILTPCGTPPDRRSYDLPTSARTASAVLSIRILS